ncbi:MAG: hypothetical protein QM820_57705 [Minicystis sp.]
MLGPLAVVSLAAEASKAEAPIETAPEPASDVEAAPSPESFPIERCAAIAAQIDWKPDASAEILKEHRLTDVAWAAIVKRWTEAIDEATERDETTLLEAYDAAYVERIEQERGPIRPEELSQLLGSAGRGNKPIEGLPLPREGLMRIKRVGLRRMAREPGLATAITW